MHYNRYRDYDLRVGQFIGKDPFTQEANSIVHSTPQSLLRRFNTMSARPVWVSRPQPPSPATRRSN
ncbi:hypothetical protein [Pseudomonas cremoricolorata]|uniref:hypothetical protein n=1 Tax=Pseudomonas cremoricolorata TaxID=157783 RepID=UPI003CCB7EBD